VFMSPPPTAESGADITELLARWGKGDCGALDALIPVVHRELRRLAHRCMRGERSKITFETTELINEVYVKLLDCSRVNWRDRSHFFAMSARLMRRILVDMARSRRYRKRGGGAIRVTFEKVLDTPDLRSLDWVALDDALNTLESLNSRISQMVELRFFGGLSVEETAEILKISLQTVYRDWRFAKTWLRRELARDHAV
jgi:RNA polymerase sigma-70 factor, ECF subfamily